DVPRRRSRMAGRRRAGAAQPVHVDDAAHHFWLGACAVEQAIPLAALGQRIGLSLVRVAPEPDRRPGLLPDPDETGRRAGTGACSGGNDHRLLAAWRDSQARRMAASLLRTEAAIQAHDAEGPGAAQRCRSL